VQRLLAVHTFHDLQILRDKFFNSKDKFINQAGLTIGVFASQINKLVSTKVRASPRELPKTYHEGEVKL